MILNGIIDSKSTSKKYNFGKKVQGNEGTFEHLLQRGYRHKNGMNIHRSFIKSHYNSFFFPDQKAPDLWVILRLDSTHALL